MKLFDLHCDTATECEKRGLSLRSNSLHWDFDRACSLFTSSVQIAAIYIPDPTPEEDAWNDVQRVLSFLRREDIPTVYTANDLLTRSHGILPAIENGKAIGRDLTRLSALASRGIVYITVTWNGSNALGNGCLSGDDAGLTAFGKEAVKEMHRVGILPDVSHLNPAGFWDVAELSSGHPLLASHSDSFAVCAHPRNLTDEQFSVIQKSGGLVGLNLCREHLGVHSFEQIERHLVHFWELDGCQTTALGMDLDGTELPCDWNGVEVAVRLYEYLLGKQYPETLIRALFFENSHAFFTKTLTSREKCIRIGT